MRKADKKAARARTSLEALAQFMKRHGLPEQPGALEE
jgi:hypothetical protein